MYRSQHLDILNMKLLATMDDQMSAHSRSCSSYISTPVLSPTDSTAFSDSLYMQQQPYREILDTYSSHELPDVQNRWHRQPHYVHQRVEAFPASFLPQHSHQQADYGHVGSINTISEFGDMSYDQMEESKHVPRSVQRWIPVSATDHRTSEVSLAQLSSDYEGRSSWHRQPPQRQPDCYRNSRHDSIASISAMTAGASISTSIEDMNDGMLMSCHDSSPAQEQQQIHSFHDSPLAIDHVESSSPTTMITGLHGLEVHSTSSDNISTISTINTQSPAHSPQIKQDVDQPVLQSQIPAKRKRGRPKLNRNLLESKRSRTEKPTRRQPHNEIERKYREGLNTEMDKLREAIPQPAQGSPVSGGPQQKPTKASVLKTAVEEIERLKGLQRSLQEDLKYAQRERDEYRMEAESLKQQAV